VSEELVDVLGGGVKAKAAVHRDGDWHVAAHVWIVTPAGRVLLQRRARVKENWPGYWDVSAAGHLSAGESAIDAAIRETREELGLAIAAGDLTHIGTVREQCVLNGGMYIDNEVHEVFVVVGDVDPGALALQPSEVDEVRLIALHEMQTVAPLVPHAEEYALLKEWCR
jgi:isopentenyl-diphosphate Delta-isomerase